MRTKNALQLRPLADRVIISRNSQEEKSPGGIVIPQTAHQEKPQFGVVVAVGPGAMQESGERGIVVVRVSRLGCAQVTGAKRTVLSAPRAHSPSSLSWLSQPPSAGSVHCVSRLHRQGGVVSI